MLLNAAPSTGTARVPVNDGMGEEIFLDGPAVGIVGPELLDDAAFIIDSPPMQQLCVNPSTW